MPELDLSQVEEVPVEQEIGLPFPMPPVETIIRQAAINVMKGHNEHGQPLTVLQFITPFMIYGIQLDENAARILSDEIRPSGLVVAGSHDMPKG